MKIEIFHFITKVIWYTNCDSFTSELLIEKTLVSR